jgi:Flp pilus assembly CpaE family ATPase
VLLRPSDLASAEKVRVEQVARAVSSYQALFDHVIVDTHPSLDELNLLLLDAADRILLVTTPEISAIHHTSRFLEVAGALNISHKLALVLNRAGSGIRARELESQLGFPVAASVVSAGRAVVEAATNGKTLFEQDPTEAGEITRDLGRLVEFVAGTQRSAHGGDQEPLTSVSQPASLGQPRTPAAIRTA